MLFSPTGPELLTLEGVYPEYQLMSQGLTAARIDAEGKIDSLPEADVVVEPTEIDHIIGKIPRFNLVDAAAFEDDAPEPIYPMNIKRDELAVVCYGLRVVHRAARLQRVVFGGWGHEVVRRLDEQIAAYDTLQGELSAAMRASR